MAKNFLYFASAAPDSGAGDEEVIMIEASNVSHYEMEDATSLFIYAVEGVGQEAQADGVDFLKIDLTITSGKHKDVMRDIAQTINKGPHSVGFTVIADVENSVFCSDHISGVSIAVIDA